jgi:hypothetical protein
VSVGNLLPFFVMGIHIGCECYLLFKQEDHARAPVTAHRGLRVRPLQGSLDQRAKRTNPVLGTQKPL